MATLRINMKEFNAKFKVYSDNVTVYEVIKECAGKFTTSYPDRYTKWLNDFCIFYTLTGSTHKCACGNDMPLHQNFCSEQCYILAQDPADHI